jgi:hypothetical protein
MCDVRIRFLAVLGIVLLVAAAVSVGGAAWAAAPVEADVQGLYEGTCTSPAGAMKLEARVVAQGGGNYNVFVRQLRGEDEVARVELSAKTAGDAVTLVGKAGDVEWKGAYAACAIEGQCGPGGTFQLHRVERKSPTLGKQPPAGAVVLLDGKNFSELRLANGAELDPSKLSPGSDGSIQVPRGGMNSNRVFPGNLDEHVEFLIPLMPSAHGQGRGNSGVFLPNHDEIQVLDSFGEVTYLGGGCGGTYAYKDPDTMEVIDSLKGKSECKFSLASLPPLAWQTYDIEYRVELKDGKPVGKPRVTVYHNGIKIHDRAELRSPPVVPESPTGKLHFQDHGNPVRFRNIWVVPVP